MHNALGERSGELACHCSLDAMGARKRCKEFYKLMQSSSIMLSGAATCFGLPRPTTGCILHRAHQGLRMHAC